jgi:tetratricopeptide (TPR) repeat protein
MRPAARAAVRFLLLAAVASAPSPAAAQSPPLVIPRESPAAHVSQVLGLAEFGVAYSRPAVNGRTVWGTLVPFGEVWRAGANENTVLTVSTPFTVAGTRLPAGRYGVHMIPTPTAWTVILSRQADAWGSFRYDPAEDALRFTVTPKPGEMTERLQYTFDVLRNNGLTLTLRWERLAVPIELGVDHDRVVLDSLATQLRGIPQFFPDGWGQAATWALQHDHLPEASAWADSAIKIQPRFDGLTVKAAVLERQGDRAAAERMRQRAYAVATEAQLNAAGYQLLGAKRVDDAIVLFQRNVKAHPDSWNAYDSLAEAYGVKGETKLAIANYQKAAAMTGDPAQKRRIAAAIAALR